MTSHRIHKKKFRYESAGFTLIVSMSLIVLIAIIAVGMLSLSAVSLRAGSAGELRVRAQANARMALMLAIGQLQRHAGPDTRVTANANLLTAASPNPQWLGVW